jgi:hypothetical protein
MLKKTPILLRKFHKRENILSAIVAEGPN